MNFRAPPERPPRVTQRQAFYAVGGILGTLLVVSLAIPEVIGIGPEVRAYSSRLEKAKSLGFDPGAKGLLAREAARPEAARKAFTELEAFLRDPRRFELPKPSSGAPPAGLPTTLRPVSRSSKPKPRTLESFRADLRQLSVLSRAAEGGSHMDWSQGYSLLFPSYAPIKGSANVADALARADAAKGRFSEATRNILDSADVWRAHGDTPIIIGDLVRSACSAILFRASGRLLAHPDYPASEARRLAEMAEGPAFGPRAPLRDIFILEFSMLHDLLDHPEQLAALGGLGLGGSSNLDTGMRFSQVRKAWQSDVLRLMNETVPQLPTDPYDFNGAKRALEQYDQAASAPRGIPGKFVQQIGNTFFIGFADAQRKREAHRRVLLVAAALRSGESETALRKRLGPLAIDPYDGAPLRIRPAVQTPPWLSLAPALPMAKRLLAVYSVGPNGSDEGGRTGKKPEEGDLVLVVPR